MKVFKRGLRYTRSCGNRELHLTNEAEVALGEVVFCFVVSCLFIWRVEGFAPVVIRCQWCPSEATVAVPDNAGPTTTEAEPIKCDNGVNGQNLEVG